MHNETMPALTARVGAVDFRLGKAEDNAALCAFVRAHAMEGAVRLAAAMEPSFWDAVALMGDRAEVLVAVDGAAGGEDIVGLGVRTMRSVYLGGVRRWAAHLSLLRIAPPFRRRRDFLRAGYAFLEGMQGQDPADVTLTTILKENKVARRLLEAGVRGLPQYSPVAEIHSFTFGTKRPGLGRATVHSPTTCRTPVSTDRSQLAEFLDGQLATSECGLAVDTSSFDAPVEGGLRWEDFAGVFKGGRLCAAGAVWDQRQVRQWTVAGYAARLRLARPLLNLGRALVGHPGLPPAGKTLGIAYVSHLAVEGNDGEAFRCLLRSLASQAACRGIDYLTLALAADHPLHGVAEELAAHKTESILYAVSWKGHPSVSVSATPYVEAGLL